MLKNRIILIVTGIVLVVVLYLLPKGVVQDETTLASTDSLSDDPHMEAPANVQEAIIRLRTSFTRESSAQKSAIFADSLADLYAEAGKFDSAAWFSEKAATFFNNFDSWLKAGDNFYQAYTFAMDVTRQNELADRARHYFGLVLKEEPRNLEVKSRLAMTYMSSANPMQGIALLREVLAEDPNHVNALFNLGMLSIQSGQNDRAIEHLTKLVAVKPDHVQAQLLLGVAYSNKGNKKQARAQFEKVKQLDSDPAVQATADSYLKNLK